MSKRMNVLGILILLCLLLTTCYCATDHHGAISDCHRKYASEKIRFEDNNLLINCIANVEYKMNLETSENSEK